MSAYKNPSKSAAQMEFIVHIFILWKGIDSRKSMLNIVLKNGSCAGSTTFRSVLT